ncbi:MAG: Spi family protease inhibitor, partial [Bacteroidales bacterium]|nr:Spi family protease inhibitor [Bacteroidales bacterium]
RRAVSNTANPYYVFNAKNNGGFVVIAGDDRMPEVLGYAEQGNLTQARATFESIRDGYTAEGPQDDVLDQVELRLRKLQK